MPFDARSSNAASVQAAASSRIASVLRVFVVVFMRALLAERRHLSIEL
jgi:hypothetical protein